MFLWTDRNGDPCYDKAPSIFVVFNVVLVSSQHIHVGLTGVKCRLCGYCLGIGVK